MTVQERWAKPTLAGLLARNDTRHEGLRRGRHSGEFFVNDEWWIRMELNCDG